MKLKETNINDFGRNSFVTHTTDLIERVKRMTKYKYQIEKHTTTEWIVNCQKEGDNIREPIAKCNSEGKALTVMGLYKDYDKRIEDKRK